ncbi:MAG: indolepyruvate oxidoreductase subunit beta [Capsulimonadaceae bacterium]|nr:indolepyruvate oxidoreductase subunit beta [Capsulimonadaceae bacterium]
MSKSNGSQSSVKNIVFAGLGGQGVLKASDIAATAALLAGFDVKKSELHGMSQRGGSVTSDVRYGDLVRSPMVPSGEADILVVIAPDQIEVNRWQLREDGLLIEPSLIDLDALTNKKSLNVALLGVLSASSSIAKEHWTQAIREHLAEKLHEANFAAFDLGRTAAQREQRQ